jgi:hypothetical protein
MTNASAPQTPSSSASFAIWHLDDAPDDFDQFRDILAETGARVRSVESYEEWVGSPVDVLVLRGTDETGMRIGGPARFPDGLDLEPLKGRRVVGIGGEAGRLFGRLGLELRDGHTATFERATGTVLLQRSALVSPETSGSSVVAFRGERTWGCEGLYLPGKAGRLGPVEVLARWADDRSYAPIARQQNYVFWAIPPDARAWTTEFRKTFRDVAVALAARPLERLALAEWDVTLPGTHVVEMKRSLFGSDVDRAFRFRFDEPLLFTAELEIERGDEVMLFFHAEQSGDDNSREDGKAGDTLRIAAAITAEDVRRNQGRYWVLRVSNFGLSSVRGTLRIDHPKDATLRFPDGLTFAITDPPRDAGTIDRLIALLSDRDAGVAVRAAAALQFVGPAAVPALKAAEDALEYPRDLDRMVRLSMLADRIAREDD